MILGQAALLLNLFTIAALCLFLGIVVVSGACRLTACFPLRTTASTRRLLLWSAVLLPWLAACTAALVLVFSEILGDGVAGMVHWHHIHVFNLHSWHGLSVLGFLLLAMVLLLRSGLQVYRHLYQVRLLMQLGERDPNNESIILSERAEAFTSGLLHPRCFYTSSLCEGVSADEFAVIRLHEEVHARSFDPLKKWLFALLSGFFPGGTRLFLSRQMALCIEQCADEQVARQGQSETLIAQTLVKVARLAHRARDHVQAPALSPVLGCHFAMQQLDARVHYLLNANKGRSLSPLFIVGPFLLLTAGCLVSADAIHHTIESLFSH